MRCYQMLCAASETMFLCGVWNQRGPKRYGARRKKKGSQNGPNNIGQTNRCSQDQKKMGYTLLILACSWWQEPLCLWRGRDVARSSVSKKKWLLVIEALCYRTGDGSQSGKPLQCGVTTKSQHLHHHISPQVETPCL